MSDDVGGDDGGGRDLGMGPEMARRNTTMEAFAIRMGASPASECS